MSINIRIYICTVLGKAFQISRIRFFNRFQKGTNPSSCTQGELYYVSSLTVGRFGNSLGPYFQCACTKTVIHELPDKTEMTHSWQLVSRSRVSNSGWTTKVMGQYPRPTDPWPSVPWRWLGGMKGIRPAKNGAVGVLPWLSVWSEVKWFAYGPADANATSSSLAPVKSKMVYLSGAGLPRLSWKKAVKRM